MNRIKLKMAAHSGGVDWAAVVKPILSTNYGNLSKADVLNIIEAILRSENEFNDHDPSYGHFYLGFVSLAADTISGQCNLVCQTQVLQIIEASAILIKYILDRLSTADLQEIKWILPPLKSLTEGKPLTEGFDQCAVSTFLRCSKFPEHSKSNVLGSTDKESPKSEMKRSRSDLSTVILQQLTTPLGANNANTWAPLSEELTDCTQTFTTANIACMKAHNAGEIILNVCCNLPMLSRYRSKYEENALHGKPLYLPLNYTEATHIKNLLSQISGDISILSMALSLPVLEPLTPTKISQLSQCAMSALYCAVLASISASVLTMSISGSQKGNNSMSGQAAREAEEQDVNGRMIVDKALEIFTAIGNIFKTSTRSHIYQNHLCFGAWLLVSGIQGAMGASGNFGSKQAQNVDEQVKGKSPSRGNEQQISTSRVNLFKVQQGFGVLNSAIAGHSLTLITELIEDLKIESRSGEDANIPLASHTTLPDPAGFEILEHYTSLQRVIRVLNAVTIQQLFTFLATISYRKACTLRRSHPKERKGAGVTYSDSATYFNDAISCCSDDSETEEEEEDSESYLGLWFKETLSPGSSEHQSKEQPSKDSNVTVKSNLVSAKDEPHEYLDLAAQIFAFLDQSLGTNHRFLSRYVKSGLSDQQMVLLANILKDLDRDASRVETENSTCAQWQIAMIKFSGAIGRYMHNLISEQLLNENLQSSLLLHLGVSPWQSDNASWPLQVYSRTLSVLVQILLLKPTQEKEAACLSVWHRLVNSLVEGVCGVNLLPDSTEYDDLNVEHAQLLLFLFHSLNLMQKKSILLLVAGGVIRSAEVARSATPENPLKDSQLILLSRLLLFLEYLMKHLYNAPTNLLEQIRWNLFSTITLDANQKVTDLINNKTKMLSFCRKDIEDKYKKYSPDYMNNIRPKFYSLTLIDSEFKLDGLAWTFILCTPDKLKYPLLVEALADLTNVTDFSTPKTNFNTRCAIHYVFTLSWKLLTGLPPSTQHVEQLMTSDKKANLNSLIWSVRCLHPFASTHYLIVHSLIKQGMFTPHAEAMWNKLTDYICDFKNFLHLAMHNLNEFFKMFSWKSPRLTQLILFDATGACVHALLWAEQEGIKPAKIPGNAGNTSSSSSSSSSVLDASQSSDTQSSSTPLTTVCDTDQLDDPARDELIKDVLVKFLNAFELLRESTYKTMLTSLTGPIPQCLIENLIAISSSKSACCSDLSVQFMNLLTGSDKEAIAVEWKKNLVVLSEENVSSTFFVSTELHTQSVIEAHINELSKHSSYTNLISHKHALQSGLCVISFMIPKIKNEPQIVERLKETLIPMLHDIRTEYLYEITTRCINAIFDSDENSESQQLLSFNSYLSILSYSYRVLIGCAEISSQGRKVNMNEQILHTIIKIYENMIENPMGMKALHSYFFTLKQGNLVELLLSFESTRMSQGYSTKMLTFFEKLFHAAEKPDSLFPMECLSQCVSELTKVDTARLKNWFSHILLGPGNINQAHASSGSSSNAQTPTNMATVSAIPSISDQIIQTSEMAMDVEAREIDQIMQSSDIVLDEDAMDIDESCNRALYASRSSAAGQSSTVGQSSAAGNQQSISAWQGNSFSTRSETPKNTDCIEKNSRLLQSITTFIVSEHKIPSSLPTALFQALIQLGQGLLTISQEAFDFADLLQVMVTLADSAQGRGHAVLFSAAIEWLEVSKAHVLEKPIVTNVQTGNPLKSSWALSNVTSILRYMTDLLQGLGFKGGRSSTPPWEEDFQQEIDDLFDDVGIDGDEDSAVEDSDEDSLCNKLCTFSQTQKEFMNQHWYHCHTCNMVDGVGVCSVCARVCHKNHDVSYAKYGNFFCDCGAKGEDACQALSRRLNSTHQNADRDQTNTGSGPVGKIDTERQILSVNRRRAQSPPSHIVNNHCNKIDPVDRTLLIAKTIEASKDQLSNQEHWKSVVRCLLEFFELLMPSIRENCALFSTVGCHRRAKISLERLHQLEKTLQISDQIMVATLGSQEGAFENVRMNYSGEQGQTIKQLLSSGLVRRVALCCLSSPHGKRQHLAVSHEKGKVTILQLSALLKQADAAKRKLTLTQLASAPIPCTILSLAANPSNEDCLAVCGLKECYILTFSGTGAATEHIVLTPKLETANFIKKAIWLPGSQTKLALVTADFVKIYELSENTYNPQYYFLVAVGKIRDCTFVYQDGIYYMLLIASSGYIYCQQLNDESLAKHGDFYVTNTLDLTTPNIRSFNALLGQDGTSIYYSHVLQMLFFSYSVGRSFMAPLTDISEGIKCIMQLQPSFSNCKSSCKGPPQPLCQWTEIPGHPGLICAMMQTSNNPVIFMIKPDAVIMQEIKAQSSKAKIMDMVAIRHTVAGTEKTTLILLCEDGSLRIYTAHVENTGFWLTSEVQPIGNQMYSSSIFCKSSKRNKKSAGKCSGFNQKVNNNGQAPNFPIDFFEHCHLMPEVEFGGNDLLQIYNTQKLKTRLFSTGMYVASTRPSGFTLEVVNSDPNMVPTGIRILIGTQDPMRAPQSVTILGRTIPTPVRRPRWFDIPLTREESLQSDKKLSIAFGRSQDPENVCMLDGIKVYGKTKELFGWPEESEESATVTAGNVTGSGGAVQNGTTSAGINSSEGSIQTFTMLDKMITSMLEVLDSGLNLLGGPNIELQLKQKSISVGTDLLLMPTPNPVQVQAKCVLATLHGQRYIYHLYKDREILSNVNSELKIFAENDVRNIDPEAFYRLVLLTRGIAVARPQLLTKICSDDNFEILPLLVKLVKKFYLVTPKVDEPTSIVKCGLSHTEAVIHCLVEIIYAFALSDCSQIETMTKYFVELLLDTSKTISHAAKDAIMLLMSPRAKRRKLIEESPPVYSTPTQISTVQAGPSAAVPSSQPALSSGISQVDDFPGAEVDQIEPMSLEGAVGNQSQFSSLEALLGSGGYRPLMDLQQDTDDEAIMDIAIALSLQEHEGDLDSFQQDLANAQNAGGQALQSLQQFGVVGLGESNASAGGSDDEGSNVAQDGSVRRDPVGSGGSESGGSGFESIGAASASSNFEDQRSHSPSTFTIPAQRKTVLSYDSSVPPSRTTTRSREELEEFCENENTIKLHTLRSKILNNIVENLDLLETCNGHQAIPLLQVILILTSDLDGNEPEDQQTLNKLLTALVDKLEMNLPSEAIEMAQRSAKTEVQLVMLCLIGVLMGKTKSSSKTAGTTTPPHQFKDNASFVAGSTANVLMKSGAIPYCLVILQSFLPYWRAVAENEDSTSTVTMFNGAAIVSKLRRLPANNLLKPVSYGPKPDISSLFPQNYIKPYSDIFDAYQSILTEIAVRLPYQILKLSSGHPSSYNWYNEYCESMTSNLCEYMMITLSPILRRQVRKLLLYVCGNKERFRLFRDGHTLRAHMECVKLACDTKNRKISLRLIRSANHTILTYDGLVEFTEHLRACQEVATVRTGNWQRFCLMHEDTLPTLIQITCSQLDEGVSPIILQLLLAALCSVNANKTAVEPKPSASVKSRQDRDRSEETETGDSKFDASHCRTFVDQIFNSVTDQLLLKFVNIFLFETNITNVRWQAHALIYAIYENSNDKQKERLLKNLWEMWPLLPAYGRRTAQFVDLLGYLTLSTKSISDKLPQYTEKTVSVLRQQNELLLRHPNGPLYSALSQVLELDGFYLESEPCLVCNNPEVPMSNIKLATIKSDSKFTTTTTIVKLVQSHTISKIVLRIADLKRTKMVRTINIYYNNRTVQAVVELKNRPSMWHKARKITLQSGQTEVKIDFPLPITACNLMIEYADFYETVTGSSENLQCPRCSSAVPAYPGVCGNCGENVFQCHKCRAINYDEKDPFLCHACGFCKYAKFDYSIHGRTCCAVDPIESAEDRTKTVQTIHSSLDKADRIYRQLQGNKQILELLVQKVAEHKLDRNIDDSIVTVVSTSQVNKVIQLLAQKYCVESKTSFEELSKVAQKVKACRRELVAYDRSQLDLPTSPIEQSLNEQVTANRCYGCALASTEQCLTLLRAMASNMSCRINLCEQGLVEELAQNNLRRGTIQIQDEVRHLLCLLTRDVPDACKSLCDLIHDRVKMALNGVVPLANIDIAVRHEMSLLEALVAQDDSCWEEKLKVVFELFLNACRDPRGPAISVIQPCLRIIQSLIVPPLPTSKANKDLSYRDLASITTLDGLTVDYRNWLDGDEMHSFDVWKQRMPPARDLEDSDVTKAKKAEELTQKQQNTPAQVSQPSQKSTQRMFGAVLEQKRMAFRKAYLSEKYGTKWRYKVLQMGVPNPPLQLTASWLQPVLFNTSSRFGRQLVCELIQSLSRTHERNREIINLLTEFLKFVGEAGEASAEFLQLYRYLADETPWRQYLALRGVLTLLADLLNAELEKVHKLEETSLSSDLAQGYALRQLVELMSMFLENAAIRQAYKGRLLGPVLQGYLSLRKLVVQRTRLIDVAQEKLLEMLEEMTSGTEEETRAFMAVLIETVEKTPINDIKTPVYIFERLYSIIHPEENDEGEFFLTLEKDPQQEDFLQGRMLGNPYPSSEAGLGPLMRDVKNKICTDCELIALLEDDNGMELLVNNKIISLDLQVKEVYKRVWLAEGGERDSMRVIYRMRGLLGDATEEFVETLNNKSQEEVDTEQLYRMANVLADCNGLKVMLDRISNLQSISRTRELVQVLLKLFMLSVKVRRCLEVLCQPELGAINTLLKVLQMCLQSENDNQQSAVTEQLLEIMETILSKAASDTLDSFLQFSLTFGGPEYVTALISCTNIANVWNSQSVLRHLIRVLAALVYGNEVKMALLCEHFEATLDFSKFDAERTHEDEFKLELFCVLTNQIEHNSIGGTLKDYIIGLGIVDKALSYITQCAPCVKPTLLRTDSDELKEFISRPSLKYILRFLTGLATRHEATQVTVSKDIIPIIHRLEQVSSNEHVGSLAENLLEALCTDETTAKRVQEVRDFTRAEKKRLAMATREKQLDALGMRTNEKGQVTAKGSILQKIEKLRDETGLTCFICREGYACQPTKVLGIYTFTKRTNVEEFEIKPRKTLGYTTVTHFNVVHVDCHTSAIRMARGRDEWERASLQNANTRCNGLLPLWGPEVTESSFSSCMSRHNSYMQESTQRCDITFSSSIHDLKLLLVRFAWEKSFHEDAGGGGPQSNMHLVPYLLFYTLYISLSSRSFSREEKTLSAYLNLEPSEQWLECAYEVEGPLYQCVLSLAVHTQELWKKNKVTHLKRLLAIAQARSVSPNVYCKALLSNVDRQSKDYAAYKPYLMFWGLIDLIYQNVFKTITTPKEEDWPISLFDYIRRNDEAMLKSSEMILATFTDEYLPCTSFAEFCDVAGLLNEVENPDEFLNQILQSMPSASPA